MPNPIRFIRFTRVMKELERALGRRDDRAVDHCLEALRSIDDRNSIGLLMTAQHRAQESRYAVAIALLDRALAIDDRDTMALRTIAQCLAAEGEIERACSAIKRKRELERDTALSFTDDPMLRRLSSAYEGVARMLGHVGAGTRLRSMFKELDRENEEWETWADEFLAVHAEASADDSPN